MACFENRYHPTPSHRAADARKLLAEVRIGWLALERKRPDLAKLKGNTGIKEEIERMKRSGNNHTFAQYAEMDADYEESRLCNIIRNIGIGRFEKFIDKHPSEVAKPLGNWWQTHRAEDEERYRAEQEKNAKIAKAKRLEAEARELRRS